MTESGTGTATWGDLFERAVAFEASESEIREVLERRRGNGDESKSESGSEAEGGDGEGNAEGSDV
jgi:hypothetical protein